jgi:site-specific DNA recombinase
MSRAIGRIADARGNTIISTVPSLSAVLRGVYCFSRNRRDHYQENSGKEYLYYRCSRYTSPGHPRIRLTEQALDVQVLALFDRIRLPDDLRHWFQQSLLAWSKQQRSETEDTAKDLQRQVAQVKQRRDSLLNLRIMEEITADTYAAKDTELRDRLACLELQLQAQGRGRNEHGDLAIKVFELSQSLKDKWLTAESLGSIQFTFLAQTYPISPLAVG